MTSAADFTGDSAAPAAADPVGGIPTAALLDNPLWGEGWPELRAQWPLEPSVAHLNHGSYGAVPEPVLTEQSSWRLRMESNPVRFFTRELPVALEEARAQVAAFLGTTPEALAFVPNATTAASVVLRAVDLGPGDEVLVTDHAYGAVRLAAEAVAARRGARLVASEVPLGGDDAAVVAALLDRVTPATKVAVVDHVTSSTAMRMPLAAALPALRDAGVLVVVDGAHAPGMLPVDLAALEALGADVWFGNLHKWAYAPRPCAVLHVARAHRDRVQSLATSWNVVLGWPRSFDALGTLDPTAHLSAPRGLRYLDGLGAARVRAHNVAAARHGQQLVAAALGADLAGLPDDEEVSMRLVQLPAGAADDDASAAALQARIGDEVAVEVAITTWRGRGFVRLSGQVYTAPAEFERLAAALPALL